MGFGGDGDEPSLRRRLEAYKVRFLLLIFFLVGFVIHFVIIRSTELNRTTLIGIFPLEFYSKVADAIIIAAIVGITYEWYAKESRNRQLRDIVNEEVGEINLPTEKLESEVVDILSEKFNTIYIIEDFGLKKAYEKRGPNQKDVYGPRLNQATESIDILGFGLRTFKEDFLRDFEGWAYELDVRVLLIDPEYPDEDNAYADQRDMEERSPKGKIKRDVESFVSDTKDLIENPDASFEVRLYTCLPSVTVFRIDDEIFWGPYTVRDQSRNMPVFLVTSGSYLYKFFQEHFEKIWNDDALSRPVSREWL